MFYKQKYIDRLAAWKEFRSTLETSNDPIQDTIDLYNKLNLVNYQADPYDKNTWPSPWELIEENVYCPFVKILGICYTLQLTDRLNHESFEIHITQSQEDSATYYLLYVGDRVVGLDGDTHVNKTSLPKHFKPQETYVMSPLQ